MSNVDEREISAIREAASIWVVDLNDEALTAEERARFMAWLRRSPEHVREYLKAEEAWKAMGGAAGQDVSQLPQRFVRAGADVLDFPASARETTGMPKTRVALSPRTVGWGIAAGLLFAIAATFGPALLQQLDPNTYTTKVGQTRQVVLADGTRIELNTRSRVRVHMTAAAREVVLEAGEAFFDVARDPRRPFQVRSATAVVRVLGTQFNVYRESTQAVVTVLEGRVAVQDSGSTTPAEITAGQRVALSVAPEKKHGEPHAIVVDPNRAVAWRQHRLIFENESLQTVVKEFNRYNARQLVLASPALETQRISGVFKADRPDALVDFLTKTGGVKVIQGADPDSILLSTSGSGGR